jgi:hypothetical protein
MLCARDVNIRSTMGTAACETFNPTRQIRLLPGPNATVHLRPSNNGLSVWDGSNNLRILPSHLVHFWSNLGVEHTELGRIPFNSEKEQNSRKALIHRNLSDFKV